MNANTFKPTVETLERRETPAVLLHVTAAQQQQIIDIAEGNLTTEPQIDLPVSAGKNICIAVEIHGQDGDLWNGPMVVLDDNGHLNPQCENALVWLTKDPGVIYEDGSQPEVWTVRAVVWGCGDNAQAYSTVYAQGWEAKFVVLTMEPLDDGKLGISQQLANALQAAQLGDVFEGPGALLDGMASDPKGLAAHAFFMDAEDNLMGELYTLKLALPQAAGGFQVLTLTHDPGTTWDAVEGHWLPELWTLTQVETVGVLPTEAGLYQLKVV